MSEHTTLVTGGTGFVGGYLVPKLDRTILTTRDVERAKKKAGADGDEFLEWSDDLKIDPTTKIESVVNLMGESIAEGRWTDEKKKRIRSSRIDSTRTLVDQILKLEQRPKVMVSASAVGIYGDPGEVIVDETYPPADNFLGDVCVDWENEALRLAEHGVRVVLIRIGIVLGRGGGAMEKMLPLFKMGLGGRLGSGKQWVPWIHVDDLAGMILWAIENDSVSGPVNASAPNPVRNSEMTQAIAKAVGRFAILPAPKFALRIALGEFANSLFSSQRVVPGVANEKGYSFQHSTIESALDEIVDK
ncbi:TIGR01777 family oxidoreductase [Mariniblastus fucicola]|uniref:Epimerase family protein n=1 Tax=Mariniblastus fucicola TaxID=980251 RepID=A0A5B9P914_9BACT|nr:TIGR01777 family oxidoreductase [Mariniblastus fucicola]QEG21380.1 Epimerase family protein [Mariniblastus fucicola]